MSVILITGGSHGIGASAAEHCAQRGMGVILTYKNNPQAADSIVSRMNLAAYGCKLARAHLPGQPPEPHKPF